MSTIWFTAATTFALLGMPLAAAVWVLGGVLLVALEALISADAEEDL